ncbi:MAG TPA: acyl-CoA dehydrogenase family protein [Acidimicrobiia bacterium]|nr:acyl-CoA dehydrogenase family protein [Acidimicrobiia bacterium]
MDFELDNDQILFRNTVREFVDRDIRPVAREWETSGRYPHEVVAVMRDMGLFGITIPEEHGGLGLDFVTLTIVFEELSRGWMGIAGILGSHSLSCYMIDRYGTREQRDRLLPQLATGDRRTAIALTEPDTGSDLASIRTTARRDGEGYVLNGTKFWITNARFADPLPVLATVDPGTGHRGLCVFLVPGDAEGLEVARDIAKLGYRGPESCEVVLRDVWVSRDDLLGGEEGRGFVQVVNALGVGRLNIAGRAVGVAQDAYDRALAYSRERHAFGRPISGFQAIQLKLAEMAIAIQSARLLTWWAADALQRAVTEDRRADVEAGMAKYFASETALKVALESLRVHGGAGYAQETEIERLYRDAPLMAIGEGTNEVLLTLIAKGLVEGRVKIG